MTHCSLHTERGGPLGYATDNGMKTTLLSSQNSQATRYTSCRLHFANVIEKTARGGARSTAWILLSKKVLIGGAEKF